MECVVVRASVPMREESTTGTLSVVSLLSAGTSSVEERLCCCCVLLLFDGSAWPACPMDGREVLVCELPHTPGLSRAAARPRGELSRAGLNMRMEHAGVGRRGLCGLTVRCSVGDAGCSETISGTRRCCIGAGLELFCMREESAGERDGMTALSCVEGGCRSEVWLS